MESVMVCVMRKGWKGARNNPHNLVFRFCLQYYSSSEIFPQELFRMPDFLILQIVYTMCLSSAQYSSRASIASVIIFEK